MLIILLVLAVIMVAGTAAYFSIIGLAKLFAGSYIAVVIMGSSLEFGKIVVTSYLYNFWKDTSILLRCYFIFAILTLISITSMGIAGFLTSAYQTTTISINQDVGNLSIYEEQLKINNDRKLQIDKQIADVNPTYVTAKLKLKKEFEEEIKNINSKNEVLNKNILEIKSKNIEEKAKIGPIIYITEVFGISSDKAILLLIFVIVLVFDPLAVALTIALNKVYATRKNIFKPLKNKSEVKQITETDNVLNDIRKNAYSTILKD